ncbi:hypothetical protein ABZP36_005970 [Zizania latifolia]
MSITPMKYRVYEVVISGHLRPIVLQGTTSSSALVTLANFVLLSGPVPDEFKTDGGSKGRPRYVRPEVLMEIIERAVMKRLEAILRNTDSSNTDSVLETLRVCRRSIQLLPKGINFNPKFTRLLCLHEEIIDGSFGVLFKNNHLSLVYKHRGMLLTLQEDEEQVKKHPNAVWKALEEVNSVLRLLTGNFTTIEQDVMTLDDKEAVGTSDKKAVVTSEKFVLPFGEFAMKNDMHKIWVIFDFGCKKVTAPTYVGRKAAIGFLNFMLRKHKSRRCWDGSFLLEDMEVLTHNNGSMEFVITKKDSDDFTREKVVADFNRFCEIIFPYFLNDEVDEMPTYFDQFQDDYLVHMPKFEDEKAYDRWQKYMSSHFAFKSPQAITNLITETYEVCDSERTGPTYALLDLTGDLLDWNDFILNSGSLSLNETFNYGTNSSEDNYYVELTYWSLLVFGRHFSRHMLPSKRGEGIIIQVQDLAIVHLMLAHALKGEMAKMIQFIMKSNNFDGSLTFDEDAQEVLNMAENVQEVLNMAVHFPPRRLKFSCFAPLPSVFHGSSLTALPNSLPQTVLPPSRNDVAFVNDVIPSFAADLLTLIATLVSAATTPLRAPPHLKQLVHSLPGSHPAFLILPRGLALPLSDSSLGSGCPRATVALLHDRLA